MIEHHLVILALLGIQASRSHPAAIQLPSSHRVLHPSMNGWKKDAERVTGECFSPLSRFPYPSPFSTLAKQAMRLGC